MQTMKGKMGKIRKTKIDRTETEQKHIIVVAMVTITQQQMDKSKMVKTDRTFGYYIAGTEITNILILQTYSGYCEKGKPKTGDRI